MPSPYAQVGATLVENGYSALPVVHGGKAPGIDCPMRGWTKWCERLPFPNLVDGWSRYGEGVGIALGEASGWLVAVDIDTADEAVSGAILEELPPSSVQKAGAKGRTLFYRGSASIRAQSWPGVLDLLAAGRFVVLPPTVHPSGCEYRWLGPDTLLNTSVEELPVLPDDTGERLAAALLPHGLLPTTTIARPQSVASGTGIWTDLKRAALANLDAWVPALGLPKTHRSGAGWRAVAAWRGVKNANVSFHPAGIRDMAANQPYSPIDVVMAALGMDFPAAAAWLEERLGMTPPDDGFDVAAFVSRNLRSDA